MSVAVIDAQDLAKLVEQAVCSALDKRAAAESEAMRPLSLKAAAKIISRRPADLVAALAAGDLKGTRRGRDWRILRADLRAWNEVAP